MDVLAVPPFAEFFRRAFPGSECLSTPYHHNAVAGDEAHNEQCDEEPVRMQDVFHSGSYCSGIDS